MPGCVSPSSGPITCTIPCRPLVGLEEPDAVLGAVALERDEHLLGERVGERPPLRLGRDDVVDGGEGAPREAHPQAHLAQHREGLRARDLVDQVQADEELRLAARQLAHRCARPRPCRAGVLPSRGRRSAGGMIGEDSLLAAAAPGVSSGAWNCSTPRTSRPARARSRRSSRSTAGARARTTCSGLAPLLHGGEALVLCPQGPGRVRDPRPGLPRLRLVPAPSGAAAASRCGVRAGRGAAARLPRRRVRAVSRDPPQARRARASARAA